MTTVILFDGRPGHWLRFDGAAVLARGERPAVRADEDVRVIAVMPAADTILHSLDVGGLTDAQARAAARLALAETSAVSAEALHVAVGPEIDERREVIALDATRMTQFLVDLAAEGLDPDAVIPALLVPPVPIEGHVRAILDGEAVVRGTGLAFADDPALTPLLAPGEIVTLTREESEAALAAAAADPPVDLRQGPFAKRRVWAFDRARLKRIQWLAAACLATLLLVPFALLVNLNWTASAIEARNIEVATAQLPPGAAVVNPVTQLDERLGAIGLQAGGALPLAAAVGRAVEATPGVEIASMGYSGATGLRVSLRAPNAADHQAVLAKLSGAGLAVSGSAAANPAQPVRDVMVRRP